MDKQYLSCAETAKLVRAALKAAAPGVKFSVRSDTYAGGASIRVAFEHPSDEHDKAVAKVCADFAGGRFDGSIDMAYSVAHYLLPNGSVVLASSPGSEGSGGYQPKVALTSAPEGARLVRMGADYIFAERNHRTLAAA